MVNNINFLTVILVALVTAVIVSLITASITGNVIKVKSEKIGTQVYTKAEINQLLANIKAVSCDGDGICEAKSIEVKSINSPQYPLVLNGTRYITLLTNLSASDVTISGRLRLWNGRLGLEKPTYMNMSYYLCIAEDSNVYRSSKPCIIESQLPTKDLSGSHSSGNASGNSS